MSTVDSVSSFKQYLLTSYSPYYYSVWGEGVIVSEWPNPNTNFEIQKLSCALRNWPSMCVCEFMHFLSWFYSYWPQDVTTIATPGLHPLTVYFLQFKTHKIGSFKRIWYEKPCLQWNNIFSSSIIISDGFLSGLFFIDIGERFTWDSFIFLLYFVP